jgi:rare lipoprotein A
MTPRLLLSLVFLLAAGCARAVRPSEPVAVAAVVEAPPEAATEGLASWYGAQFAGKPTASGEPFDPTALTAAHRTLPFGACVRVTSVASGKSVQVRINDRGPFVAGRMIDLSEAAAAQVGLTTEGVGPVRLGPCQ